MAAPSEETEVLVGELPTIVDHIEFEDAPKNITPDEGVTEQPEVSVEDEAQEIAVVEEIEDHPEIVPEPIADEAVEEDADKVDEHHDAIGNAEAPEESTVETTTEETLIDPQDGENILETAAEEIEDEEPEGSEMVSETGYEGEETSTDTVSADDTPEMDEFEAALTQDLMETDDEVESRADQDTSAADDVSDEFDDTQEDEPQVAKTACLCVWNNLSRKSVFRCVSHAFT